LTRTCKSIEYSKVISFDTETTSTEEMRADIVGISLAIKEGEGYYIPVGHKAGNNLPLERVLSALKAPLTTQRSERSHTTRNMITSCWQNTD
jgi:DNA polymerase-1